MQCINNNIIICIFKSHYALLVLSYMYMPQQYDIHYVCKCKVCRACPGSLWATLHIIIILATQNLLMMDSCLQVSERDWRMTFLPQFKACVDAGSWSLMCSYNRQLHTYTFAQESTPACILGTTVIFHTLYYAKACKVASVLFLYKILYKSVVLTVSGSPTCIYLLEAK